MATDEKALANQTSKAEQNRRVEFERLKGVEVMLALSCD